jgi:hypothetical protein
MEQGGAKNKKSLDTAKNTSTADTPPFFPTPQYVFNIFSPIQITTSESNIGQQALVKSHCSKAYSTLNDHHERQTYYLIK